MGQTSPIALSGQNCQTLKTKYIRLFATQWLPLVLDPPPTQDVFPRKFERQACSESQKHEGEARELKSEQAPTRHAVLQSADLKVTPDLTRNGIVRPPCWKKQN